MKNVFAALSLVLLAQASFAADEPEIRGLEGTLTFSGLHTAGAVITLGGDLAVELSKNLPKVNTGVTTFGDKPVLGGFLACSESEDANKPNANCYGLTPDITKQISGEIKVTSMVVEDFALIGIIGPIAATIDQAMTDATRDELFTTGTNIMCMLDENPEDSFCLFGLDLKTGKLIDASDAEKLQKNLH